MRKLSVLIVLLLALGGCSSKVEKAKKDYVEAVQILASAQKTLKTFPSEISKIPADRKKDFDLAMSSFQTASKLVSVCRKQLKELGVPQSEVTKLFLKYYSK